jgi:hypothetical protein
LNIARKREKSRKGVYEIEGEFVPWEGTASQLKFPRFARGFARARFGHEKARWRLISSGHLSFIGVRREAKQIC